MADSNSNSAALPDEASTLMRPLLETVGGSLSDLFEKQGEGDKAVYAPIALIAPLDAQGAQPDDGSPPVVFRDRDSDISDGARLANALVTLLANIEDLTENTNAQLVSFAGLLNAVGGVTGQVDEKTGAYLDVLFHDPEFQALEANWTSLKDLAAQVTADDVIIDFYDATKEEIGSDLSDNALDIFGSTLFTRVYVDEYDRYGGRPFATMIGLYEFSSESLDVEWLRNMQKICAGAQCPFVGSVMPQFFNGRSSMAEVAAVTDLDAIMGHPRFGPWNALRDEDWSAYIGLTLPRYMARLPWDASDDTQTDRNGLYNEIGYVETVHPTLKGDDTNFLWGSAAMLFARNVVRSYENSGWAQHIRGPIGGGEVDGMLAYTYRGADGKMDIVPPVEIAIPDYREYQFSRNGLISLVHKKGEATATFFSAQSIKKPREFVEDLNTKNAFLVTNLAYTYSITIIAHYVKVMMREYIGSAADGPYIQQILSSWLSRFVTTVTNPDDLTLLYYPFKATTVEVEPKPGPFGWYVATVSILPHIQFEGMDVELRLEAALGGKS